MFAIQLPKRIFQLVEYIQLYIYLFIIWAKNTINKDIRQLA